MSWTSQLQKFINVRSSSGFFTVMKGMKVLSAQNGKVCCQLKVEPQHLNGANTIHGGMLCTLVDQVSSYAIAIANDRKLGVSADLNISFLRPASPGENITIESEVIKSGPNLAFANVYIFDEKGKPVATGRQTKYMNAGVKLPNPEFDEST